MKILKILLLAIAGLVVLLAGGSYLRNKLIGPEGWALDNTEAKLKSMMKDPASTAIRSAQTFSTVDSTTGAKTIYICGVVDGKNSFGAYSGGTRFVSRSVSTIDTFDTYEVDLENPEDVSLARAANMPSAFEKVYWAPYCSAKTVNEKS
ncbi:hypothetical protein IFT68_00740 [Oxalobacteraceae sp. CFBP 13730]|nr:hypothetical protein [Oxalobacteraceae sp. CFBP 13730]